MNLTFILILIAPIALTFWAIIDLAYRDFGSRKKKALWGLLVVFVPYLGGPIYLIFGRRGGKITAK